MRYHKVIRFMWCRLALLTGLLATLSACEHKELYMIDSNLVRVRVDFNYDKLDRQPTAMRVLFYPLNADKTTGRPYMFDINGTGGYVNVPEGDFRVLAYNVDNENIIEVSDDNFDSFQLTTSSNAVDVDYNANGTSSRMRTLFGENLPKAEGEQEFLLYDEPDYTCRCRCDSFHVNPSATDLAITTRNDNSDLVSGKNENGGLTLVAEEAFYTLEFDVKGIEGLSRASYVRATVSGVAASLYMSSGLPSSESGMVSFACKIDAASGLVHGSVRLWGYQPEEVDDVRQFLNIYVWASSGNYYFTNDVTRQLTEATEQRSRGTSFTFNVEAILDLTQGSVGDSGFQPSVGDWSSERRSIYM